MIKKYLIMLIAVFFVATGFSQASNTSGFVKYQAFDTDRKANTKILVLPLDENFGNNSISSYSANLNNIAIQIVNQINQGTLLRAMPIDDLHYKIRQNKLEPEIQKVIYSMRAKGLIEYRTLATLCNILGTDKVILVAGDFNTFKFFIQPHPLNSLDFKPPQIIKPAYSIDTLISLIDPYEQSILWSKNFNKKFTTITSHTDFEHNPVTIKELKRFSSNISRVVSENVNLVLLEPQAVTSVDSNIINTNNTVIPMDGVTTKDGHSFSTTNKFAKPIKEKYIDWSIEHL